MSLAWRRALGALGGAAFALPLAPIARRFAERIAGPPLLPGRELASGDVKAGTYAEFAALVLAVSAAAFLFGHLLPRWIGKNGGFAIALPGLAAGTALPLWRAGVPASFALLGGAAAASLLAAASILGPRLLGGRSVLGPAEPSAEALPADRPRASSWRIGVLLLLLVFAGALRFWWRPHGAVDLFETGLLLAPAQSYLGGGTPYVDTYPVHGWGADGGLDAALFALFDPTLGVLRARHAVMVALAVAALALASWTLFRGLIWSAVGFMLGLGLCPYLADRQLPAFLGLAALVWAAESESPRAYAIAGAVAGAAAFYALDFGLILVLGAVLTVLSLGALGEAWASVRRRLGWLTAGVFLGAGPFLGILLYRGAADDFARVSFSELPARISDIWSVPAAAAAPLLRDGGPEALVGALVFGRGVPWLFHAAIFAVAAAVLIFRAARGPLGRIDRGAVAATWAAIVAMRGALGRADDGHLALYGVFAALPAAWLLYRAAHAEHVPWLWTTALGLVLVLRAQPQRLPAIAWSGLRHSGPGPDECRRSLPRSGAATIPCGQAEELAQLRGWLDGALAPHETYFDFGNEPALYFLLDRRPPIRYGCVPLYEGEPKEGEVIAALERERPPLAILSSGTSLDAFDDVSNRERAPRVAAYLDRHYEAVGRVGSRTIGRRRPEP